MTLRGRAPLSAVAPSPSRRTSSSWMILTTCWPGVTPLSTSWPAHSAWTRSVNSRATLKWTSAERSAVRTSASAAAMFSSESLPTPRRLRRAEDSLSVSVSNIQTHRMAHRAPRCNPRNSFWDGYAGRVYETIPALMNPILKLLVEGGHLTPAQLAQLAGLSEAEVDRQLDQLKKDRILLGWRPVLDLSKETVSTVRAVIEVRITPERGGGFDRIAERLSRFDEVESCYLMSGGYDLLIFVNGPSLQKLAGFVSEKLATLEGVVSTSTHFILRSYKEGTFLMGVPSGETGRLKVSP